MEAVLDALKKKYPIKSNNNEILNKACTLSCVNTY